MRLGYVNYWFVEVLGQHDQIPPDLDSSTDGSRTNGAPSPMESPPNSTEITSYQAKLALANLFGGQSSRSPSNLSIGGASTDLPSEGSASLPGMMASLTI